MHLDREGDIMLKYIKRLFKQYNCKHKYIFIRNIYGDEINHISSSKIYRSWWECERCNKYQLSEKLFNIGGEI